MVTGLYIFPDGQFIPRWTRISSIAWGIYTIIVPLFFPFILSGYTWRALSLLISMIWFGSCALAQFQRFRHTTSSVARQQTRWVVYGITISVLGFILSYGSLIALMQIPSAENIVIVAWLVLIPTHMVLFPIFPLSVAFAIFRYRLFDLDLLINRSLVYGLLALILVVLSLCAFFTVQTALGLLTNSEQPPQLALFASVALLALAYNPIYARIRHFVDTRIYDLRADLDELARPRPQPEIKKRGELTGLKIGAYDLLDPLGKGGMGEVYKGWHRERDEIAAVKVLADNLSNDEKVLARFHREADAIRQLQHPHIIGLHDFVRQDGRYFMMLDYLDGQSLDDYLKSNGVLSLEAACRILAQIASALDYVHAQQVIHRDIKPANILLRVDGQEAVLSDFGIAKVGNVTGLTGTDATIGTVSYMSPEQIIASKEVTKNADIYSLGVTLYEMLTGHLPFEQGNIASVIFAHLQKPAPDIRELRPDLPHSVSGAIQQAMEKEPENRFASAGEFAAVICQAASSHDATQR
jgi:tRNA A-37 threonylcarbamoyl transferase component Bud32